MRGDGRDGWLRVPVGAEAVRWTTRGRCKLVLLVVHNVTSATRLLDVLPLFRDDLRVQLLATCTGSSPFRSGVAELLAAVGVPVVPWEQALALPVDLAVSASFGGELHALKGALTVLSHGVGYNKRLAAPGGGQSAPDAPQGQAPVFGLSPDWLLHQGATVADTLVLSHPEQRDRLRAACPEALPTALLAGDPCYDRLLGARQYRARFRRALDVRAGQRLVVLNSTWNPESLFGDGGAADVLPSLLPRLASELPADEYRIAAVLHPNIWHGHGPGQVRAWLDGAVRGGLVLVDPLEGWRQALVAADAVIGDFGSVSYYAAALGTPVLLAADAPDRLDPASPVAAFARQAPRLAPGAPLLGQLDALIGGHRRPAGPGRLVSSAPGRSAALLRRHFYGRLGVPEPPGPALRDPLPLPPYEAAVRTAPLRVLTRVRGPREVEVARYADPAREPRGGGSRHTAVDEDTLDPGRLGLADVILRHGAADDPRFGGPAGWAAEVHERHPGCALAAYVTGPGTCVAVDRAGREFAVTADPAGPEPGVYASALYAVLAGGARPEALAAGLTVVTGGSVHHARVSPGPAPGR
ncbi:hypothetical protein [Streptomyces sp. 8L]|uniref:hypothetical protein n=1 Tax=Streptomyces sp. 8L TaxID=2877242 RepID=UPI001CD24792|nr:hypothetical protein [Streptomyces sp. 8L]MCA1223409.1 hypothetical protein [Streptomyces sp. 8L]